jgi:hypothetical protein
MSFVRSASYLYDADLTLLKAVADEAELLYV